MYSQVLKGAEYMAIAEELEVHAKESSRTGRQCAAPGEYAIAEDIREILRQEQEHQIDLATALGEDVPDVSRPDRSKR